MAKVMKYILIEHLASRLLMPTGVRILADQLHRFGTCLKSSPWLPQGFRMASWLLRGFCIAFAWLPSDPGDSRRFPISYEWDHR